MIKVTINDQEKQYASSIKLADIANEFSSKYTTGIVAAFKNNQLVDLAAPLKENDLIEFIDSTHEASQKVLLDSLTFLFSTACADVLPKSNVSFNTDTNGDILCLISVPNFPLFELSSYMVRVVHYKMIELVERDVLLARVNLSNTEINRLLNRKHAVEDSNLFNSLQEDVDIYYCDGYFGWVDGPLVPSARYIKSFHLSHSGVKNTMRLSLNP